MPPWPRNFGRDRIQSSSELGDLESECRTLILFKHSLSFLLKWGDRKNLNNEQLQGESV